MRPALDCPLRKTAALGMQAERISHPKDGASAQQPEAERAPPQRCREAGGCWKAAVHMLGANFADPHAQRSSNAKVRGDGCATPGGILRIDRHLGWISPAATAEL